MRLSYQTVALSRKKVMEIYTIVLTSVKSDKN